MYILELFYKNPIGQTLGIIAFTLLMIAFSYKKDKKFYIWLMFGQFIYSIHLFVMGLYSGAFTNLVNSIRTYTALRYKHIKNFLYIFLFIYILIGFLTYKDIYSILPIVAGILGVFAFLYFSGLKGRLLLIVISSCWLLYAFIGNSIGGVISELFIITINLFTIIRILKDGSEK